ncbi:MAG TPA: PH domain-containing protein [Patescibacteria group bacterium]|nr:PH domain-containing protein [Patescibacteria group bacterium]
MSAEILSSTVDHPRNIRFYGEDEGEEILYIFRRSFVTNVGWILMAIFMLIAPLGFNLFFYFLDTNITALLTPSIVFSVNAFWYLFTFGFIYERFLNWYFNVYIVTGKRIVDMDFYHLLSTRVSEAPLRNIEDVTYRQTGVLESVFNIGSIFIQTAAENREFEFDSVANPAKVHDILTDLVREVKGYGR